MLGQISRFGIIGLLATAVHFSLLVLLVEADMTNPTRATLVGSIAGIITSYIGNYWFVFKVENITHGSAFSRFILAYLIVFTIHGGLMFGLEQHFSIPYVWVFIAATGISAIATFLANRYWVFRIR